MLSKRNNSHHPEEWLKEATADFSGRHFKEDADFSGFVFPGDVRFNEAIFERTASFDGVCFNGVASFFQARFKDKATFLHSPVLQPPSENTFKYTKFREGAWFVGTEFVGSADFGGSEISGSISFDKVAFCEDAIFRLIHFKNDASFRDTKFAGDADFSAIQVDTAFLMDGVEFSKVPDFWQATFVQAPRLNNIDFGPDPNKDVFRAACKKFFFGFRDTKVSAHWQNLKKQGRDLETRCLALMRLATQGNDREREQLFFQKKWLARRWVIDKVWHASFWVGWLYHLFSDFGRSLSRPLVGLFTGGILFAVIYLCLSLDGSHCVACDNAGEHEVCAAFKLSLSRSLPALWGLSGFGAKVQEYSECLYGQEGDTFALLIGLLQSAFSLTMIFLLLLALRNRFRIG